LSDKVSIVVPTRNRRDILRHALRSARSQSWPAIEVVVVDEASTDGTARMLSSEFSEVRVVIHDVPHGPGGARNAGIAASTGDWVLFLDDDDLLHQDHIKDLLTAAREAPVNCIVSGRWRRFVVNSSGIRLGPIMCAPTDRSDMATLAEFLEPMGEGTICTPSTLWPRSVFKNVQWDEQLFTNGDVDFFGSAVIAGMHFVGRPVGMAYYRSHPGQRVAGGGSTRSVLSAARYRLKWSQLLLSHPEHAVCAEAMRNGFMSLMIGLAGLPDAEELMPFLQDAYRMWGGRGYYVSNPPQHSFKRWIARGALKLGGLTALHWLLKQAARPQRIQNSDMALYGLPTTDSDLSDAAAIRALDET
jgi:hypothetical protein